MRVAIALLLACNALLLVAGWGRGGKAPSVPPASPAVSVDASGAKLIQVEHVYDGCGTLCYLGALQVGLQDRSLSYVWTLRYANPSQVASSPRWAAWAAERLGYHLEIRGIEAKRIQRRRWSTDAVTGSPFGSAQEALQSLLTRVDQGVTTVVGVDLFYLWDVRKRISSTYPEVGHAGHIMTVVGYDSDAIYVHDPQKSESFARYQRIPRDVFMAAWEASGCESWHLKRVGGARKAEDVLKETLAQVPEAIKDLDRLCERLSEEDGELSMRVHRDLSSVGFRRRVLADWLQEAGDAELAHLYRRMFPYYDQIMMQRHMRADEARRLLLEARALEVQVAGIVARR